MYGCIEEGDFYVAFIYWSFARKRVFAILKLQKKTSNMRAERFLSGNKVTIFEPIYQGFGGNFNIFDTIREFIKQLLPPNTIILESVNIF